MVVVRDRDFNCSTRDNCGTIFEVTPAGVLTTLRNFDYGNGASPASLTSARRIESERHRYTAPTGCPAGAMGVSHRCK
jgi:hypothetical protein